MDIPGICKNTNTYQRVSNSRCLLQLAQVTVLLPWLQSPDSDACPWPGVLPLAVMVPVTMSTGSANAFTAPLTLSHSLAASGRFLTTSCDIIILSCGSSYYHVACTITPLVSQFAPSKQIVIWVQIAFKFSGMAQNLRGAVFQSYLDWEDVLFPIV